jgi:putative peptide zinc metalloprotease protein
MRSRRALARRDLEVFMQNLTTPRLRAEVAVQPFNALDGDGRFVVAVDDRHFLVSAAIAAVLEESRRAGTLEAIAQRTSARLGLAVTPQQVETVLREQAPSILFAPAEGSPERARRTSATPLHFRRLIACASVLRPLLQVVARLFTARWAVLLAVAFIVVESMVAAHALAAPSDAMASADTAAAVALTMLGVLVHELGHLGACVRYNAPHGGIGIGLYWCVPVFFAEVHGAWMLARQQRAVVDVGGLYLQSGYVLLLGALYLVTGAPAVLTAIVCSHFLMLHTLNPVLKYDGYWLLSDLTGTHNLHRHVRCLAERVWSAVRLSHSKALPTRNELGLLGGFVTAAGAYFAYVLGMLGRNLGSTAARLVESWRALDHTSPHALGQTLLLALLLFMAVGLALLLARSLGSLAREQPDDR